MGKKLCPKIILEGTRLTFKTEIAFKLNEHPRLVGPRKYQYHSPLVSGEWCAFTNYPWGRGLINFNEEEEGLAMETYQTWVRLFELQKYYSWIIDRFHLSTKMCQLQHFGKDYDFQWLENRLKNVGFRLVYLYRTPESFKTARERRLKVSGNPGQYDDLSIFVKEQEMMDQMVEESLLPTLRVDVSDNDIDAATERIVDWMVETGAICTLIIDKKPELLRLFHPKITLQAPLSTFASLREVIKSPEINFPKGNKPLNPFDNSSENNSYFLRKLSKMNILQHAKAGGDKRDSAKAGDL